VSRYEQDREAMRVEKMHPCRDIPTIEAEGERREILREIVDVPGYKPKHYHHDVEKGSGTSQPGVAESGPIIRKICS